MDELRVPQDLREFNLALGEAVYSLLLDEGFVWVHPDLAPDYMKIHFARAWCVACLGQLSVINDVVQGAMQSSNPHLVLLRDLPEIPLATRTFLDESQPTYFADVFRGGVAQDPVALRGFALLLQQVVEQAQDGS